MLPELLDQIPEREEIGTVTADGAYDTRRYHTAIHCPAVHFHMHERDRPSGNRHNPEPQERAALEGGLSGGSGQNETLRTTRHYGKVFWKRWTGYHARSRIEVTMRCLKVFGERIAARDPDRQTAEIHIRIALVNRFNALGTPEIVRIS